LLNPGGGQVEKCCLNRNTRWLNGGDGGGLKRSGGSIGIHGGSTLVVAKWRSGGSLGIHGGSTVMMA
jgi:hypothetical protein